MAKPQNAPMRTDDLRYDEDTAFTLADDAATVSAIVRRTGDDALAGGPQLADQPEDPLKAARSAGLGAREQQHDAAGDHRAGVHGVITDDDRLARRGAHRLAGREEDAHIRLFDPVLVRVRVPI